ncbi:unnamed protein product [Clonostachys byssicola]|uniref:Enoyl reductase (ER) domain-containing protein n=1 Tax=Clonostachys byssicola TaxID=160290 RepID=A0A9N9UBD1_9HYPO|nr:unnamed protein product [Clonostachys byssicola]
MPYSITIKEIRGKAGKVYYPLKLNLYLKPSPGPNEVLVKLHAAALNRRDFFIRQHLYPDISFKSPLLSDGYGTVVETGPGCRNDLLNKKVVLTPSRGWQSNPEGPEDPSKFTGIGGMGANNIGCAQDYVVVDESEVEVCPEHLNAAEAAALPSVGLTAWRAFMIKSGNAKPGHNILVTGIGGGVALQLLQFGVAVGCNVYVTSGDAAKINKAKDLGAKGGVNYKTDEWEKELSKILPAERPYLDAVIDGAGGDIVSRTMNILKPGGVIVSYGMTVAPVMDWLMHAVLRNVELKGSTLGSRTEFTDMVNFVRDKQIRPIISRTVKGLESMDAIEGLFDDLRTNKQFGKLVIEISSDDSTT